MRSQQFKRAFQNFLKKYKNKKTIKVKYFRIYTDNKFYDLGSIGYVTKENNYHGIHCESFYSNFYFGTAKKNCSLRNMIQLEFFEYNLIPTHLKKTMEEVSKVKKSRIIKNNT